MVEPVDVEYCNVITIKGKQDNPKPKIPFFLRALLQIDLSLNLHKIVPTLLCALKPS